MTSLYRRRWHFQRFTDVHVHNSNMQSYSIKYAFLCLGQKELFMESTNSKSQCRHLPPCQREVAVVASEIASSSIQHTHPPPSPAPFMRLTCSMEGGANRRRLRPLPYMCNKSFASVIQQSDVGREFTHQAEKRIKSMCFALNFYVNQRLIKIEKSSVADFRDFQGSLHPHLISRSPPPILLDSRN